MKSSQRSYRISLIGAGKVCTTLAVMLRRSGNRIVAVVSADKRSARRCASLVACKTFSDDVAVIPPSTDFILIAVPDSSIRSVAQSVALLPDLQFHRLAVCHTSGARTSDELIPLAEKGATVFSLHPAQTFPPHKPVVSQIYTMKGVTYGIEGPKKSLGVAKRVVQHLGGTPLVVPKEAKILYHTACVVASNYAVTLVGAVEALAKTFAGGNARLFKPLMETSIANALDSGAAKALTGPVARGDVETIAGHLKSIEESDLRALYRSLGRYALKLAAAENRLSAEDVHRVLSLLNEPE